MDLGAVVRSEKYGSCCIPSASDSDISPKMPSYSAPMSYLISSTGILNTTLPLATTCLSSTTRCMGLGETRIQREKDELFTIDELLNSKALPARTCRLTDSSAANVPSASWCRLASPSGCFRRVFLPRREPPEKPNPGTAVLAPPFRHALGSPSIFGFYHHKPS